MARAFVLADFGWCCACASFTSFGSSNELGLYASLYSARAPAEDSQRE
jgi:hypothetical protein